MISCPECEATIDLDGPPQVSEIVECPECAGELEVVGLDPIALAPAPAIEEDWGE